ncbi:MAG: hypothetical protein RLO81_00240, partial [Fulvivirga sp.]|uniref:hypothetical protein n=1 Tax=Fulvivirga sp. TaxID=1931237 RepID=UPI0032ED3ED3
MRNILSFFTLILLSFSTFVSAQVVSSGGGTGDWNDPNSWIPAAVPTTASGTITILNGHSITVSDTRSADQITVSSGGSLTISSSGTFTVAAGSGDDLTINAGGILNIQSSGIIIIQNAVVPPPPRIALIRVAGTLNNAGTITNASSSTLIFESGSVYDHQYTSTAGTIPTASWDSNSTCQITGYTSNGSAPSGLGQSFGNFTWATASLANFIDLNGALTSVAGNLTFQDIPFFYIYLTSISNYNLNIGGNLVIDNCFMGLNSTATANIAIGG